MTIDKLYHLIAGLLISGLGFFINPWIAFGLAVLAGIGKEVYDKVSGTGTPELLDALATLAGAFIGVATIYLIKG